MRREFVELWASTDWGVMQDSGRWILISSSFGVQIGSCARGGIYDDFLMGEGCLACEGIPCDEDLQYNGCYGAGADELTPKTFFNL